MKERVDNIFPCSLGKMNTENDNVTLGNEIEITHIQCDSNDSNTDNIIIEVSELSSENVLIETECIIKEDQDITDSPELINIGEYKTEHLEEPGTVSLCETLYESEASNEFNGEHIGNSDGQYLTLIDQQPDETNIIEDLPNEVLVYTCQPEHNNPLEVFPCKSCGMVCGCIFCLKSHYESIHLNLGLIQYKCEQTSYLKNYTQICHKCNLVCESRQEMFDHRKIHFVTCDVCDMSFDSALFLSNHCKISHEKFEVIISCDLCEQWFKHLQDLSDHYQNYHEMILCIVCFKRFSNRTELTEHHSTHKIILTDVKPILPYACSKCNQAFAEISELSSHLVRDHPNRKASYGSLTRKRILNDKAKHRKKNAIQFDDCGGLRQDDIADFDDGYVVVNTKKTKSNND